MNLCFCTTGSYASLSTKGNVIHVGLHLGEGEGELVMVFVLDRQGGGELDKVVGSSDMKLGKRLRPERVRFSTRSRLSSVYSMRGIGMYPTLSMRVGTMTLRIAFQRSAMSLRVPSESKSKSLVR